MGRDNATFWDKGTEVSREKGTTGQAKNLAMGREGPGQRKFGKGWDSQNLGRDGPGQPKSGTVHVTKRDRVEKDILEQEKDVLKH